jgi:hypothetical protein
MGGALVPELDQEAFSPDEAGSGEGGEGEADAPRAERTRPRRESPSRRRVRVLHRLPPRELADPRGEGRRVELEEAEVKRAPKPRE